MPLLMLSPLVRQQFNYNGAPVANGLLFTYAAGTTNKIATYKDQAGTLPNTNPIVLDENGACDLFLDETQNYKIVLSPSGDTDPPTNPYWTRDNINPSAGGAFQVFNQSYATAVGGYVVGTILQSAVGKGLWLNIVAGNTNNPDTGGAGWCSLGVPVVATAPSTQILGSNVIFAEDRQQHLVWQTIGTFTGYASPQVGLFHWGSDVTPRAFQELLIGQTIDATQSKYAALLAYLNSAGLVVPSASWTAGTYNFVNLGSGQYKMADMRNQFIRATGTDADTANPRTLGSYQADALQNITGAFSANTGGALNSVLGVGTGAFKNGPGALINDLASGSYSQLNSRPPSIAIDASLVARTSTETRGPNTALSPMIYL